VVAGAPLVEIQRADRLRAGGAQQSMLSFVPVLRPRVDTVPGELVDEQERRELRERVEPLVERMHVVEDASGDHHVPGPR
jgi:hypothetical protein